MKKLVRITFAAVLGLMLSLTVSAASGTIASGTGWTLDENGTLTITEGMETEAAGWRDYAPQIQTAVLTKDAHPLPDSPFLGCTSLTAITVEEGNPTFFSDGGVLYLGNDWIPHSIMAYPSANPAKEYVLPETVKNIASYAFADARYLERVTLHGDMEWILDYAFRNCSALTEVNVPEDMAVHCSSNVFEDCTSLDPTFV
ncbi:MAG: leucine-rich repeat protein, partial [Clostridia bacterium]|nr:leucine-rich repeat protein [Clostridia bacterium]